MRSVLVLSLFLAACSTSKSDSDSAPPQPTVPETPKPAVGTNKPVDCPTGTLYEQCRSFAMNLTGRDGKPPGANDLKGVTGVIGDLVTRLKVKNYYLIERHADGGFQACLEPVADGGYEAAVYAFSVFSVGNATMWDVHPALNCTGGN